MPPKWSVREARLSPSLWPAVHCSSAEVLPSLQAVHSSDGSKRTRAYVRRAVPLPVLWHTSLEPALGGGSTYGGQMSCWFSEGL